MDEDVWTDREECCSFSGHEGWKMEVPKGGNEEFDENSMVHQERWFVLRRWMKVSHKERAAMLLGTVDLRKRPEEGGVPSILSRHINSLNKRACVPEGQGAADATHMSTP